MPRTIGKRALLIAVPGVLASYRKLNRTEAKRPTTGGRGLCPVLGVTRTDFSHSAGGEDTAPKGN